MNIKKTEQTFLSTYYSDQVLCCVWHAAPHLTFSITLRRSFLLPKSSWSKFSVMLTKTEFVHDVGPWNTILSIALGQFSIMFFFSWLFGKLNLSVFFVLIFLSLKFYLFVLLKPLFSSKMQFPITLNKTEEQINWILNIRSKNLSVYYVSVIGSGMWPLAQTWTQEGRTLPLRVCDLAGVKTHTALGIPSYFILPTVIQSTNNFAFL